MRRTARTPSTIFDALLYSATTDDLIPWERLQRTLRDQPPLTRRERCELLLRAVNGDQLSNADWTRLVGAPLPSSAQPANPDLPSNADVLRLVGAFLPDSVARHVDRDQLSYSEWRRLVGAALPSGAAQPNRLIEDAALPLRDALARVIKDPETALAAVGRNAAEILDCNYVVVPRLSVYGRRFEVREQVVARSIGDALIYALLLFLDPRNDYGKELARCAWRECGRFAFAPPQKTRGQPPTYFCDDEHRREEKTVYNREYKRKSRILKRRSSA